MLPVNEKFMGMWDCVTVKPELDFGVGNWKDCSERETFEFISEGDRS